ncbi:hypothetical protein ABEW34_27620 [Paenibacillus algorifonticola]|uniref:hypothetical protein n=1 Tax=Paenibacillus algorifonticola TaxID=684063 RepID=UPI003D2C2E0E
MKKISMDFNEPDPSKFRITKEEVAYFNLKINEEIIFYTEDIQVKAVVVYDSQQDRWYGKLITEIIRISQDIAEAREDGFENGKFFGQWTERSNIIRKMKEFNISEEVIMQMMNISKGYLKKI